MEERYQLRSERTNLFQFALMAGITVPFPVVVYVATGSTLYALGLAAFVLLFLHMWNARARGMRQELVVNRALGTFWFETLNGREEPRPLDELEAIRLTRERRTSSGTEGNSSRLVYPVSLRFKSGGEAELVEASTYLGARGSAEKIARMLQTDMCDETTGAAVTRDHRTLDHLWKDLLVAPESQPGPVPPGLKVLPSPGLRVRLPRRGWGILVKLCLGFLVALGVVVGLAAFFLPALREPITLYGYRPPVYLVLGAGLILFAIPTVFGALREEVLMIVGEPTLLADPEGIELQRRLAGITWRQRIDLGKAEEVRFVPTGMVVLDDRSVRQHLFPLTPEESAWLEDQVARAVLASR